MASQLQEAYAARRLRWWHFAILALAALVLGYFGFRRCLGMPESLAGHLDLLYLSLQLFTFESGRVCGPQTPWMLQAARLLAPLVPVIAVVYALLLALREHVRLGLLLTIRNHAVVCGVGRKGSQLVRDFRKQGIAVVAIELDGANEYVNYCRNLGALVLVGNASDPALLRRAAVQRAAIIVAISGDDGVNMDSMLKINEIIRQSRIKRDDKIKGYVQVVDFNLCALFKTHQVFTDQTDRFEVKVFNIHEATARQLLAAHPLDRQPIAATDPLTPHLVCIGLGKTGEALVVQAARIGHFANGRRLRVTVIDLRGEDREAALYGCHGWIREVCDIAFITGDIADEAVLKQLQVRVETPEVLSSIAICMNNDSLNLKTALLLHARLGRRDLPIHVRMMEVDGLTALLEQTHIGIALPIYPFGMGSRICTTRMLEDPDQAKLAHLFHTAAELELSPLREPGDTLPWTKLTEHRRDAFCLQADHLPVMLRSAGLKLATEKDRDPEITSFSAEEIGALAGMEYRRRRTDSLVAGEAGGAPFSEGPRGPVSGIADWDRLDARAKQVYLDHVSAIPRLLGKADLGLRRIEGGPLS